MVIGAVTGIFGGKKAKKAAKKQKRIAQQIQKEAGIQSGLSKEQFEFEQAAVREQRRQDRISTIREARMRRASILSSAQASGISQGSSAVTGALGSLTTSFGSTLGLSNIFTRLAEQSADRQTKIMESQGRVAQLEGQSNIVQANLAKSQANLNMWGSVAEGFNQLAGMAAGVPGGKGILSAEGFGKLFGGGTTTQAK